MPAPERRRLLPLNVAGLLGVSLWVATIFLRDTPMAYQTGIQGWLGIAPNFGVALLLPMLVVNYYPVALKRPLTYRVFLYSLALIFGALLLSEVVHDLFLNSRFDIYDIVASLVGLGIMAYLHPDRRGRGAASRDGQSAREAA